MKGVSIPNIKHEYTESDRLSPLKVPSYSAPPVENPVDANSFVRINVLCGGVTFKEKIVHLLKLTIFISCIYICKL